MISIIAAIGKNNELGKSNSLLWNLPADMKHFRETTSGKIVIMGQKTFESIGKPLPNRRNIVLTQDTYFFADDVEIAYSIDELENTFQKNAGEIFIIGGGMIYKLFMDRADKLYITHVNAEFPDADVFFPEIDKNIWHETSREDHEKDDKNIYDYSFVTYEKN